MKQILVDNIPVLIYNDIPNPKKILLGVHGFAGSKDSSALKEISCELEKQFVTTICFDLPGHGENLSLELTLKNVLVEFAALVKYVKENYKNTPIDLFATSFGAYSALLYLLKNKNPFDRVFLRCPAVNMSTVLEKRIIKDFEAFERDKKMALGDENNITVTWNFYQELEQNDLLKADRIDLPITVIQGDKDDLVFFEDVKKYVEQKLPYATLIIIKGADHRFKRPQDMKQIIEILCQETNA